MRHLSISDCNLTVDQYLRLPFLFPHLKAFHLVENMDPLKLKFWKSQKAKKQFERWKNTIVDLREVGAPLATLALLNNFRCEKLQSVDVDFSGEASELDRIKLAGVMCNAPNLTDLKLQNTCIYVSHLEQMLNASPKLKVLACREVRFISEEMRQYGVCTEPDPLGPKYQIEPSLLETLVITGGHIEGLATPWLKYFTKKIPHIKNLVWNFMENNHYERFYEKYERWLIQFVTQCRQLEFYRVYAFQLTAKILQAMYDAGIRLKKIDLELVYQMKAINLVLKSKQIDCIESLGTMGCSYNSLAYEFKDTANPDHILEEIGKHSNIKHLRIIQSQEEVDSPERNKFPFDVVLNDMKQLETLKMDFVCLSLDYDSDEPVDCSLTKVHVVEGYFEAARFKEEEENKIDHSRSFEYVQEILPKTELIMEELNMLIEEDPYIDLIKKREY